MLLSSDYFASRDKISAGGILPLVKHKWLKHFRHYGRDLVGLTPLNKVPTPPQSKYETLCNESVEFLLNCQCQVPCTNVKTSIEGFLATVLG